MIKYITITFTNTFYQPSLVLEAEEIKRPKKTKKACKYQRKLALKHMPNNNNKRKMYKAGKHRMYLSSK